MGTQREGGTFPGTRAQPQVAVVDAPGGGYVTTTDIEQGVLGEAVTVRLVTVSARDRDVLLGLEAPCVILWHRVALPAAFFEGNDRCRTVICASVGYDHVDIEAAERCGIHVYHVPHYGTNEVADHTLALALALTRRLRDLDAHVRAGGWDWQAGLGISRLQSKTWGVIGLGRTGLAVARRAAAFGMTVAYYDPFAHPGVEISLGLARHHTLGDLLAASDIVSLHVPLTTRTRHLIDADALLHIRAGCILINTSRGPVVDLDALRKTLDGGSLAGAALDVAEGEPELPPWLRSHPRTLLTPHAAFYSAESLAELRTRAAQAARDVIAGRTVTSAIRVV